MNGGSLTLSGTSTPYTHKISGEMNLNNVVFTANDEVLIDGGRFGNDAVTLNIADVVFSGNTVFNGTSLIVEDTNKLSLIDGTKVKVDSLNVSNLSVSRSAQIEVSSASELSIKNLNIIIDDLAPLEFSEILKTSDGDTIVFSAESTTISVSDSSGNLYDDVVFSYDINGNLIGITSVPEPATYAAIFGALALAFAAYRRRK